MGKAAGAMGVVFTLGAGVMAMMGAALGAHIEAAVVGGVGLTLYGVSALFHGKAAAPASGMAKQA
ncbi:hypothetical protein DRW03_30800 [Corallococcus sp. H22C18031201]|nr:hypothetical protein DRW03_30800 [Corallococcus sp. H22C18031201]